LGTYKIVVEVLGKYSMSTTVVLDAENPSVSNLNFIVNGDSISLSIDDDKPGFISGIGNVYPNPVVSNASIEYILNKPVSIQISLVDVLGQVVFSVSEKSNQGMNKLDINTDDLENGLYYIHLNFNNSYSVVRKFVKA
jgi:hypothetical protein